MNINSQFNSSERPNAEEVMEQAMGFIFDEFIEPRKNDMGTENAEILAHIGMIFKDMAEKAEAYYTIQEKGYDLNEKSLN